MTYEETPTEVQAILETITDETYEECERIVSELNAIGWTADYDLGATLFGFQKLN